MIIKQFSIPKQANQSFQIRRDYIPKHQSVWHYHEEFELVYVIRGTGTLFIGDRIKSFQSGDTVLIGSQIPHYWLFENHEDEAENDKPIDCIVIHFNSDLGSPNLLLMPELNPIKQLLQASKRSLIFPDQQSPRLSFLAERTLSLAGLPKLTSLFELLDFLCSQTSEPLTSEHYSILNQSDDQGRMNNLMEYIREHYKQKIKLEDLAALAGLTENSFCRYFKQKTGKTPVQFITELRISHACSQLKNGHLSLKEICYDSGFNNFVSFHKSFKAITQKTPTQYKNES